MKGIMTTLKSWGCDVGGGRMENKGLSIFLFCFR